MNSKTNAAVVALALFIAFGLGFFMTKDVDALKESQLGAVTGAVTSQVQVSNPNAIVQKEVQVMEYDPLEAANCANCTELYRAWASAMRRANALRTAVSALQAIDPAPGSKVGLALIDLEIELRKADQAAAAAYKAYMECFKKVMENLKACKPVDYVPVPVTPRAR